jgi:hypothetical protein
LPPNSNEVPLRKRKAAKRHVPPGGPSTINGVLYQALVALSRCVEFVSLASVNATVSADAATILLVLEPAQGGDQQVITKAGRSVEQLKTRAVGTWSLRDLIESVLPDLYRSVDPAQPHTDYRFVTDGSIGDWWDVLSFFRSLPGRSEGAEPWLQLRDDAPYLNFRHTTGSHESSAQQFWGDGPFTERRMFELIARHLSQVNRRRPESMPTARKKTWHLLANLTIDESRDFRMLEDQITSWLEGQVNHIEDLGAKRASLLADLLAQAQTGNKQLEPRRFFEQHKVDYRPLAVWDEHVVRAREILSLECQARGLAAQNDVRPELAEALAREWQSTGEVILLSGEAGQGKTWLAARMLEWLAAQGELVLFVDASGDAQRDVERTGHVLWNRVLGRDASLSLERIHARLLRISPVLAARPIYLVVDAIRETGEAYQLVTGPLRASGVRLLMTAKSTIVEALPETVDQTRCRVVDVPNFTDEQIQRYLALTVGDSWVQIPQDFRSTLARPILARLYVSHTDRGRWQADHEYAFYERVWRRLVEEGQSAHPMDAVLIARAAAALLRKAPYPWRVQQLCADWHDDSFIPRLTKAGWLSIRDVNCYVVPYDRLLNWAAAWGVVEEFDAGVIDSAALTALLRDLSTTAHPHRTLLGYVPMDVMWLMSAPGRRPEVAAEILATLEREE